MSDLALGGRTDCPGTARSQAAQDRAGWLPHSQAAELLHALPFHAAGTRLPVKM